jgi:hypothetical protein
VLKYLERDDYGDEILGRFFCVFAIIKLSNEAPFLSLFEVTYPLNLQLYASHYIQHISLHHRVQTGSGVHPPSYPVGTRGSFPGGKAAGA